MEQAHNDLKQRISDLEAENLEKDTHKRALPYHVRCLENDKQKLEMENESLRVTKRHMISIPPGHSRPRRCEKATRALVENLDEQYVGIGVHIESMLSAWSVKEVAELEHYSPKPRRNWTCRGDDVTECGVIVAGGKMVAPFPPHSIADTGRFFMPSSATHEYAIKEIMEEELKGEQWKAINATEATRQAAIQSVCSNAVLQTSVKRYSSDTASSEKRVARDCLFTALKYDKLMSKNTLKNQED